uniref:Aspartate ornithine carbamoyltransferase n=1 Tax=Echinococcus granulosus TaxID=6210 RepID=A0A068WV87_ECHGR|nr:Aspartate ornithine carbamoyltransferase [Echinococcus granulosus]
MRAGETFVVSLNDSLNMSSTLSQVEAEKSPQKARIGISNHRQRGRRKLRSRRNLVDSADATNNATFEISVAPLIDTRNEKEVGVSEVASRGANRRKKLRSRRNLVDSLSATAANITFELSVAQLSEWKNEALAAASTEEASSMGALKCTAESPPLDSGAVARALEGTEAEDEAEGLGAALSHEESPNLTKNQDSSKGGRRNSLSQSMAENFVHVENDDATMEISVAPLPAGLNEGQIEACLKYRLSNSVVLETVNVLHLQAEIFPDPEVVEMVAGGAEAPVLEHVDAPRLAEVDYSNGRTDSIGANLSNVEVDSVPVIGIKASDTVVSTPSAEPSPVGDASMAISMSEVSGASVTVAAIQTPAIMPSICAIPTDFSTMEAFTAAEAPSNSAVSRNEQENGDVTRHPVEHQPEALLLCEDVSMVVSNLEVSVIDEPNPPPALKEIDDEVALMLVKSSVGADTQFIEDEPTEEKVISMVVSQMDVSASVVDSVVSMVAKEAPKRKVTYAGRWATNNVDGWFHFTAYDAHFVDSMLRIDFAKDSTRTREVAPHDQVLPTAGLLSEPEADVQIIEAQDPRAFRADSSVMVSRPEAPATDERSSSGEVNAGNACPEEAADVRSQVGAPTDSNCPHPAAESELSDTGVGGDGEVEVASLAISKSIVPDVVVVGHAAEFAPAPEAVVNVSSQTQAEGATLLEEKFQNQPKVQGEAVPDTNFTGSRSSSDSPGKKRSLRSRRLLVNSVDAVDDNVTMEISVASLAGKRSVEGREGEGDNATAHEAEPSRVEEAVADASSQTEVEDMAVDEQAAESTPAAEDVTNVPSETQTEGISTESKSSSHSPGDKGVLRSRCMSVDSVAAVSESATVAATVASLADKGNNEGREGKGDNASAHEVEPSRVEEAVVDASCQAEVEGVVVVGQATESAPTAEEMAHVSSQIQAEGVSVASRSSSASRVKKRSLRSRRMLVNSVDAVKDNVTVEISVTSPTGKRSGERMEGEGNGASAREAELPQVEEAVADASSQTEAVKDLGVDGQVAEFTPAAEGVISVPSEAQTEGLPFDYVGVSAAGRSSSDSQVNKRSLRSRRMLVNSVNAVEDNITTEISVASLEGKQDDVQRQREGDDASAHEAEPSRVEEAVADASSQTEVVEDVVVDGQPDEFTPAAEAVVNYSRETKGGGVSVASRSSSASRVKKRSLRSRRMLVNSVDAVKDNVTMEISVASLEGKESDGQRQREGSHASARETEPPRVEEVVADASSQTEVVKGVAETPSTKMTTNASNQTDTPAPHIEVTGQAYSGKVNFKRASRPVYSRKVRKILLDESVLETPQPVSPRCVWPSPLRRSGSLGYTCPSLSAVPLVETKSKNTFSSSRVSRLTGASSGTFRSLAGSQRRTITHQEIREIEEKLLDTSADVVEDQPNPQITMSNGTTLTREKESAKSAPPVTLPNDLSLSASCLDRTILQDMVLMPPPLPPLPLKHRHGAFTGETGAVVAATAASPSFSAPTSSVATGRRRSVQFAPLAEVLRQSPHGQWSRLSVGLTDQLDLSPIPKSCEGVDEVDSSTDDSGDSSDLSCFPVEENDEAEPRDTVSPIPSSLNRSNVSCHLSPTAVEVLNRWREDQSILVEAEEEKITERTYIESLLPGGESLTPEQMKRVLGCLQPSEPSPDATPCSSHPNVRSKLNEKTCEVDPSMTSLSQWLPPPSEGKVYDMDAVGNALRLMLMGWVEPQDPVFIPLPKSAYQHHVNAGPGLRRSTRIRVAPPRDSYERVYYDVRPNPTTGRLERIPLGYLRYPNQKEVRRRQQLLKNRLQVDDKDTAAVRKRARDARLHRLAAKRRRVLGLSDASHHFGRSQVIVLESDVTWVKDGTNSLPIGQLINSKGPSNLPVVFDSLNEAQSHLKGGVIQSLTECEIEPGSGLSHVGPFEQSLHDITNVISVEQKRRGLHFDAKASNLFTLRLQNPDELTSKNPLLAAQIGTYAIPLRKACCVLVPKGMPYKFISIAPNVIRLSRLRFIPP